jgi:hypothetical protein
MPILAASHIAKLKKRARETSANYPYMKRQIYTTLGNLFFIPA